MVKEMALGTHYAKELQDYKEKCLELEKKNKNTENRCFVLEVDVGNLKKKNQELKEQIGTIRKVASKGEKGKEMIFDSSNEESEDTFARLLVENRVLEYEKTMAENEIGAWKEKVKELVSRVCELESKMNIKAVKESPGGITNRILISKEKVKDYDNVVLAHKSNDEREEKVRKQLPFKEDVPVNKKMAPSTPGVAQPHFSRVIHISDEDVNINETPKVESRRSSKNDPQRTDLEDSVEDDMDNNAKRRRASKIITSDDENVNNDEDGMDNNAKRRRASKIITSDDDENNNNDEDGVDTDRFKCHSCFTRSAKRKRDSKIITSDDDNAPICMLRTGQKTDSDDRSDFDPNKTVCLHGNTSSEDEEDDGAENGSESEGESLGGFIVESSQSDSDSASGNGDSCDESEDGSEDLKVTLDKIRRKRVSNSKWDLEGEMLADFGKDPELCMRAVCAIYRQQTADEKLSKGTIHLNEQGFSQCDATRGSKLAEFLTDGDSSGDLNKTMKELKQYDPKGIKLCTTLATKYSKQLFEIYQNKEDPYFLPQ